MGEHINNHDDNQDIFDEIGEEHEATLLALRDFDNARRDIYNELESCAAAMMLDEGPDTEHEFHPAQVHLDPLAEATKRLTETIFNNTSRSLEEKITLLATILAQDATERFDFMRGCLNDTGYLGKHTRDSLEVCIEEVMDMVDEPKISNLPDGMVDFLAKDIVGDLVCFLQQLNNECEQARKEKQEVETSPSPEAQVPIVAPRESRFGAEAAALRLLKAQLGEHALDIMKLAAGASAALIIDRMLRQRS